MHRIVDTMVDNYRPEVDKLEERLDELEKEVFEQPEADSWRARSSTSSATSRRCARSCCRSATPSAGSRGASSR